MTVKSGSQASIQYQGSEIRGRSWTLNINREVHDITCSNRLRRKYRVGRRTTTGEVQLLYDPDDTAAIDMLNAVDTTEQTPTTLALVLAQTDDVYFDSVAYLLTMEGPDGSTVFTDISNSSAITTAVGNAQIQDNKLLLDGSGDYLRADSVLLPATGDFTIEGLFNTNTLAQDNQVIIGQYTSGQNGAIMRLLNSGGLKLSAYLENTNYYGTTLIEADREYHAALTRESDVWRLWLDGQLEMQLSRAFSLSQANGVYTGAHTGPQAYFNGTLDDIRVTTGARYLQPFIPPTRESLLPSKVLSVEALFTRRSISAQVGNAYACTLGFQATGPVTGGF